MPDPATMTDDELKQVVETGTVPEEPDSSPPPADDPAEPPHEPEEPAEAETPPAETAQEESTEEAPEEKPPSRREQLRIQQLLKKYGPPPERPQQPSQPQARKDALDYQNELEADPETIQRLQADRQAEGQAQFQQGQNEGLKRAEFLDWKTSLKIDAPVIEKKYPILDSTSPEFHPAVADALNSWYLKMSGFDPSTQTVANNEISYADFVESNMELVEEIAGQKNAQTVKNVAKQAATTGLRPDGSSAPRPNFNKDPKDMTTEELYATLGQRPPKK